MRLDMYIKRCCLTRRRTEAKRACDNGIVSLDGHPAKASRDVRPGQRLGIRFTDRILEVEILEVPQGNVSKKAALSYYRIIRDEYRKPEIFDNH